MHAILHLCTCRLLLNEIRLRLSSWRSPVPAHTPVSTGLGCRAAQHSACRSHAFDRIPLALSSSVQQPCLDKSANYNSLTDACCNAVHDLFCVVLLVLCLLLHIGTIYCGTGHLLATCAAFAPQPMIRTGSQLGV
eukprot:scpid108208/ scgid35587/ 